MASSSMAGTGPKVSAVKLMHTIQLCNNGEISNFSKSSIHSFISCFSLIFFKVPICDKENHLHFVECYGLKEIAKDSDPPSKVVYQKLCKLLDVDPKTVQRPGKIDLQNSFSSTWDICRFN